MAFVSKFTGPEIDRRLAQGTYDDAVAAGFTGTKEQFDAWIAAYTPQEMEKLNNKQDKEDPMLETENKTVVGAINLLNSEKQDKEDERLATESKIVVDAINELNTRTTDLYYNKQDKEDSGLATEQKTVVGAINELKLELQEQDSQKQDKVDDGFATNDKSVVGAVNEVHNELDAHVADYNKHVDEYEAFKADAENTLNSHSTQIGQLTQEKQDKTDFNLATESKTVVGAINENYAAINAEVARAVAEDARLEEVKVSYTDISDSSNPDRKTIMLKNHDSLSGYGTDGTTAYNLAMVSKWDKADFGAAGIPINLNGSETHPTYNDKEELAFVSELSGETGKLAEDIKTLNETVATVKQDLADSVSSINKNMEDGFNTINDDIDNEIRPAIEKNAKDIGVVNETLTADINYLKPRVTTLEGLQIVKVDSDSETYSASYELQDATGKVYGQRINIATDKFIKSVSYANQVLTIVFVLEDGSEYSQNIDVSELMNVYTAGGGITISETGVVSISDDTLQMIQYSDSEVRRLEKDKIPYAYDEKTQSNINVILPEGGSYLGNYGDENATVAKAAVYDGTKQLELGSSKVHTNINTDSDVTIETSTGKKTIATTDELVNVVNIPIRSLQDKVYTQEEIFDWFGVTSIPELKQKISRGSQMYLRYGILLSGNPMYYKMPIEYTAFESANQIKLVFVGLNTRDDVASKYEILINLDGTIIEGNSNVKVTITSIEPEDIDLSGYATKEELNDYALKSEIPDVSDPYEINLTNLLSAEDSESISTAIGGIDNLNATVQDNRIIVGTISNGSVSVSIRILGNVTTLYYLLDSVLGLTLNEIAITNTSGTLSKNVTTHSVLTENMVINSLNSDETTLPLSAAQGKALNSKIDGIDVSADITNAINALDSSGQTTSTGEVIASVSQENGVVSVSKKTLVSDDIPELPQSKITGLDTALAAKADVSALTEHTSNTSNPHLVTKEQVGLGNVDNTSDEDKPISTAAQAALNLKQNITDNSLETTSKTIPGAINETKKRIDNIDQTLDLKKIFAYGVEWTDEEILTSSALHRIGNLQMHKDLPIQSAMYGCIVKNGALQYKLGATNWAYKEDMVTSSVLDGTDGGIYIHVPKFYLWSENEDTTHRVYISLLPLVPDALEVPEMYVSAEKVTLDRSDSSNIRTASVVNTTANFRGGTNKTDYDTYLTTDPARCLLGKPATNISRANMRTYARNAGEELLCYDWYKALYWLYVIEYGNFNCQLAYNAELTAEGYKQGGLGNGVTTLNWSLWNSYNDNNPIVPCGYNYEIGNGTGVKSLTLTGYNENAGATVSVPRWRGLCSPFGDIWTNVEGTYIQQMAEGADYKLVYGTHNPEYFGETNEHMDYLGEEVRSEGYITSFNLRNLAHIIPLTVTNSDVGMCDYHYIGGDNTNARSLFMGGDALDRSRAGFGCWLSGGVLAGADATVGFRTVIVK